MKNYKEILNVRKIIEKHNPKDLTENRGSQDHIPQKWREYFGQGWYGFDMGWAPDNWFKIIDEFLDQLKQIDPDFKIQQIKIKFGGLRFYVSFSNVVYDDPKLLSYIRIQIEILERELFHESLIY